MTKTKAGPVSGERIKSFVERIEKLMEERKAIGGDIRDVFAEAKGVGYDVRTMRKLIQIRAQDAADRAEQETLLDVYMHAVGMEGTNLTIVQPTEEELEERAGRVIAEVDRCMALVTSDKPPKIEAIKDLIGCSTGKAHKLRGLVEKRLGQFSRLSACDRENENPSREAANSSDDAGHRSEPSAPADMGITMSANAGPPLGQSAASLDSQGEQSGTHSGEINEIHRGATQPKGCAKVVRTDASMSESVAASGDAVRDASAMPLDVVAAPHSEGREHAGSAATAPPACVSGTHSGGDAQDESCGESVSAVGATAKVEASDSATAPLRPHDPHSSSQVPTGSHGAVGNEGGCHVARPELLTDRQNDDDIDDAPAGAHETGDSTGGYHVFGRLSAEPEVARAAPPVSLDTRGEARPSLEDAESTWFSTLQRSRQEGRV
jgi:uncharacterized protein (UPF0335 family)